MEGEDIWPSLLMTEKTSLPLKAFCDYAESSLGLTDGRLS